MWKVFFKEVFVWFVWFSHSQCVYIWRHTVHLHGHCALFKLVTTHLTTRAGLNKTLKIENLNTATRFRHLHSNDRQRHTYLRGEHLYAALELSLSGFTILNSAGSGTAWLQRHREKYFPSSLFPSSPSPSFTAYKFRWRQWAVISADILPVMEALVTESCYWITHINAGTQTHTCTRMHCARTFLILFYSGHR